MNKYIDQWIELEPTFSSGLQREQSLDPLPDVNWDALEQVKLGAALSAGCALIESAGKKGSNEHIQVLFEIRNAFIHNQCDISKNNNSSAYNTAREYLNNKKYKQLFATEGSRPFYDLSGTIVIFSNGIISAIRMCLL